MPSEPTKAQSAAKRSLSENEIGAAVSDFNSRIDESTENRGVIRDATPCWAKLDWANGQIARLENEVNRRDAVLDWLGANNPAALDLCPYKVVRGAQDRPEVRSNREDSGPTPSLLAHQPQADSPPDWDEFAERMESGDDLDA